MRLTDSCLPPSRRAALALTAGGAVALALGRDVGAQTQPAPAQVPATPALPEPDETARLLENLLTRMGVKVNVGGLREPLFVIDTGAERTAISDRLAAELNLRPGPPILVHGITAAEVVRTVELPHLDFSGRRFTNMTPPVFPHELLGADGLLGLDVLSRFRLTLELRQRRVMLAPSGPDVVARGIAFGRASRVRNDITDTRTGRFGQLILTNVQADGVDAVAFIDSGAQYSIGNLALMRAVDARVGPAARQQVRVYGVIGQSLMVDSGAVSRLRLARREMGPTPLLFGDLHAFQVLGLIERPALLLGADILTRFSRITLDYGQSRIAFGGLLRRPPPPAVRSP
ncbi:pepsin/retropepsin-like aspartic protease family protein [Brevundimonas sp.]|uniref:pepsin/retropepsin-like aspartic protease family protein n=1 Tax=Brevundimonas sp. TaxID=1871086 RepID=UPI003D6C734A